MDQTATTSGVNLSNQQQQLKIQRPNDEFTYNPQFQQYQPFIPFNQVFGSQFQQQQQQQQSSYNETNTTSTSSIAGPYTFPLHLTYPNARVMTPTTPNCFDPQTISYNQNSDSLNDSGGLVKKIDET